jgi:hypothetical protein
MELLWSHGGDIYEIDIGENFISTGYEEKFKETIKDSIFKEFLYYYKKLYKDKNNSEARNEDIILALTGKGSPRLRAVTEEFEQRFDIYGLKIKKIDIEGFKSWIAENLNDKNKKKELSEEINIKKESVLKLNNKPFKETIKLMLKLVHLGGVINPIEGEFRHRALLSRNWYSRLSQPRKEQCNCCIEPTLDDCVYSTDTDKEKCSKKYLLSGKYNLLPLPLAAIKLDEKGEMRYFRSVTCLTYWSLVMLKNALSPEIGGNFIESINAPDYYEKRLSDKSGMPVTNWEVKKKKFVQFDQESYAILGRVLDNGLLNIKTLGKIGEYLYNTKDNREDRKKYDLKKEIFKDENAFIRREFLEVFKEKDNLKKYFADKKNINKRTFYHKVRQTRIAFYQLEQALHYQLRQLFIPDHNFREIRLYKDDIYKEAKKLCGEERDDTLKDIEKKWEKYLDKIKDEFRLHVIFELLTYFFHDYMTGGGD